MSSVLALAGVTAVLQSFLNVVYNNPSSVLGSVAVSAIAPDIVQAGVAGGGNAQLQVNLFLHQVTYNAAWRNNDMPSLAPDGRTRLSNQRLALDLHYLLTAYAPVQKPNRRQLRLIEMVALGSKNREIAESLGTTEPMVKKHLTKIYAQLRVENRIKLALWYEEQVYRGKLRRQLT